MPATDICEPQVVRTLAKEGWVLLQRNYLIYLGRRKGGVYADLRLQKSDQKLLVVEVKCFAHPRKQMDDL